MQDTEDATKLQDFLPNYPSFLQWQESTATLILNYQTEKQGSNYPIEDKTENKRGHVLYVPFSNYTVSFLLIRPLISKIKIHL